MVQLSPTPTRDSVSPPGEEDHPETCRPPEMGSPPWGLDALQLHLDMSTAYHGYEAYIEDGLICLKHKIRNMEKRKLKLEDYMTRVKSGGSLNKDQTDAVGQYEVLLHNLSFAQELHCSLDGLTQTLLRAQKEQEHVRRDLLSGRAPAPLVSPQQLDSLGRLSGLLGLGRTDPRLSMRQMEKAAMVYFDLLEAKVKPVAGSTFKVLKEQLTNFLDCEYFDVLPPPPRKSPAVLPSSTSNAKALQPKTKETPKATPPPPNLKAEFLAMKAREPPDSWDVELVRGSAPLIPKGPRDTKRATLQVFNSRSALPNDPVLRKKQLEDLMKKIHQTESFSFMQQELSNSPAEVLPEVLQSTPLPARCVERKTSLTNGELSLKSCDLPFSARERSRSPAMVSGTRSPCTGVESSPRPSQGHPFSTPSSCSTPTTQHFRSVFQVIGSMSPSRELNYRPESRFNVASTQTPPEFAPSDEDTPDAVYQADYPVDNCAQMFLSPSSARSGQSYHTRGYVRGTAFLPGVPYRDPGPLLYSTRESGFHHGYRRGARHNSSGWSDSSQVSSPDRDRAYPAVDSGLGDHMSVSTLEVPVTPHQAALLPVPLYPLARPVRVAFTASRTANFSPGNLDQPVVFDQLHANVGETFDPRIGRFTCPVAGSYVFLFHILKQAVNMPLYVNLMRGDEVMVSAYANDIAPDHETASNHAILPLVPGDQVWLRLHRGAIYGSTWKYSTFSGFLLYQD
ncbi:hypothetical protein NHX12_020404 [Muraenolepis orangiensis]|uniref:C1q domain-containing protein n=1 Tax=Muraenolepis orangiensis TaxID=630683 RepID=A0A9Q0ERD1_9TELE|nr:hypothetical protein NHX12_020404 [Muraenolepis orangiensis]